MATFTLFGDIKRIVRTRDLGSESTTTIFGDIKLDLTRAPLDTGEHALRITSVFGDVKLRVPDTIGLEIDAMTLFAEVEVETVASGEEEKPGASWISENYDQAPIRIRLQIQSIFGDIDIIRMPVPVADTPHPSQLTDTPMDYPSAYVGKTNKLNHE